MFDLWLGIIYIIITKHVKKINKQLMPVGWDPTRQWDWCMLEDPKKGNITIFEW